MSAHHLLSFYGSKNPQDGYAERQEHLHWTAERYGNIQHQHPWNFEQLKNTAFYQQHKGILDQERGAGFWLWKPYLMLEILQQIPQGDFLFYHDVGRAIRRDPHVGYQFSRPIDPLVDWAKKHDGMFPGVYVPVYGPSKKWIKRDCFVLMECDQAEYWDQPQVQAGINVWQNTESVRDFIAEWLEYCKDPRILTDDDNVCGVDNFPEFKDHRHDQAVLTNLLNKHQLKAYGPTSGDIFKPREVTYISARIAAEALAAERQRNGKPALNELAEGRQDRRVRRQTLPLYQTLMEEKREQPVCILEVSETANPDAGLWLDYFNDATVHTLFPGAVDENHSENNHPQLTVHSVDPSHRPSLEIFAWRMKKAGNQFDYIIENGSGLMHDQQLAVGVLFELLKPGGVILIEQLEYALRPGRGDLNSRLSNSTLQLIKKINLPPYRLNSHYFTLQEVRKLEPLIQTAGTDWSHNGQYGIGMIRRFADDDPEKITGL